MVGLSSLTLVATRLKGHSTVVPGREPPTATNVREPGGSRARLPMQASGAGHVLQLRTTGSESFRDFALTLLP